MVSGHFTAGLQIPLRITCVARVWPFGLVLGVRVSNMLVSGYG